MSGPSPPPRDARGRLSLPPGYWLPAVAWLGVMFFFSSLPDPRVVLGPDILTLGDAVLHGGGFVVLALLVARVAFFVARGIGLRPLAWTLLGCAAYGLLDETHQLFIPGRSFAWTDWLADVGGAAVGACVAWGIAAIISRRGRAS